MREPFCIAYNNMAPPFGADDLARDNVIALEHLLGCKIACRITIEKRHRRHSRGNLFCVTIELVVSEQRFVVRRDPPDGHMHEGLHTAIADAFNATRRQLQERGFGGPNGAETHVVAGDRGPLAIRRSHSYVVRQPADHAGDR